MSIIRDALNKAQDNGEPKKEPEQGQGQIQPLSPPVTPQENPQVDAFQEKPQVAEKPKTDLPKIKLPEIDFSKIPKNTLLLGAGVVVLIVGFIMFKTLGGKPKQAPPPTRNDVESTLEVVDQASDSSISEELVAPEETTIEKKPTPPVPNLTLSGIFFSEDGNSQVIINGKILKIGESIKEAEIVEITKKSVKLKFYDLDLMLRLK